MIPFIIKAIYISPVTPISDDYFAGVDWKYAYSVIGDSQSAVVYERFIG